MVEITVILDNLRSSYNVGSIARSCDAFGVTRIIAHGITPYPHLDDDDRLPHVYDKVTRRIHKTALGAERLITLHTNALEELMGTVADIPIICLEQHPSSVSVEQFIAPPKLALVVGNEVDGVTDALLEHAHQIVEIPMLGKKESLNVAVSAAITLYAIRYPSAP